MDCFGIYCGTKGSIPTSTPTPQPVGSGGTKFYELQWFWWAVTAISTIAVAICYKQLYYYVSRKHNNSNVQSRNFECKCLNCWTVTYLDEATGNDDPEGEGERKCRNQDINRTVPVVEMVRNDRVKQDDDFPMIDGEQGENLP